MNQDPNGTDKIISYIAGYLASRLAIIIAISMHVKVTSWKLVE